MTSKMKVTLCTIVSSIAVIFGLFAAIFAFSPKNVLASQVEATTVTIDVVGNLEWGAVDGADGYNWTYTVGGQTSDTYYAEDNKVNVGVALIKAAQKAKKDSASEASIKFTITPKIGDQNGTSTEYTYTFTQYIDYGYATHDITDINAKYRDGQTLAETTHVTSAMYKNDVLTMGMTFTGALQETQVWLFGNYNAGSGHIGRYNHSMVMTTWGTIQFYYYNGKTDSTATKGGTVAYNTDKFGNASTTYNGSFVLDRKEYLSMAVFDTYDLTGNAVGETIWFDRSIDQEGKLVSIGGGSYFYDNATIAASGMVYEETNATLTGMTNVKYDRSAIRFRAMSTAANVSVSSGILDSAPSLPYYDNVDASFNWNRVEGAGEYQWAHGDNAWQTVKTESVSVSSLLSEYKDLGYLPLKVRAVVGDKAGATTYFNIDLKEFYQERSVAVDISETGSRFTEAESYYSSESVEDKNAGLDKGDHVSFAFKTNPDATIGTEAYLFKSGLFGAEGNVYHNQFNLIVNNDGEIQLSRCGSAANANQRYPSLYWRNVFVEDGFKAGEKYFVTFGVDDVYTNGDKTAERITLRFYKEEGAYRRTIANISYDYRQFNDESVTVMEYDDHIVYQMAQDSSKNFLVGFMPASFDKTYSVNFTTLNNEIITTKTVKYGERFDFADITETKVANGYELDGTWLIGESNFENNGWWNINYDSDIKVVAGGKLLFEKTALSLTLDGKIGVNLYVSLSDYAQDKLDDAKMMITYKNQSTQLDFGEAITYGSKSGLYKFSWYVPAKEIDETITANILLNDDTYGKDVSYCVRDYIKLVDETDEKLYKLVVALQDYCDYVTSFYDDEKTLAANDRLNAVTSENLSTYAATVSGSEEGVEKTGISLLTVSDTTIRVYIEIKDGASVPSVSVDGSEVDLQVIEGTKYYYYDIKNVSGFDLEKEYTVNIGGITLNCNALSYAALVAANDSENTELVNVVKSLYLYSEAATAYKNIGE